MSRAMIARMIRTRSRRRFIADQLPADDWSKRLSALLGERVHVTLAYGDATTLPAIVTGTLLDWSEMGEVKILADDGDVHHCWPGLRFQREGGGYPVHEFRPPEDAEAERIGEMFRDAAAEAGET